MTQGYNDLINILNSMPGQQKLKAGINKTINNIYNKYIPANQPLQLPYNPNAKVNIPNATTMESGVPVNWVRNTNGGEWYGYSNPNAVKTITPKSVFNKTGIKGLGGPIGAGMALLPEFMNMNKWTWNNMNLNTMDPEMRNAMLRAVGKENEIPKYEKQQTTIDDLPMPMLSKAIAKWVAGTPNNNKKSNNNDSLNNNSGKGSNGSKGSGVGGAVSQQLASQLSQMQGQPQGESNGTEQQANSQAVIDYINKLQEINRPYIDSLQNYLNNYDKLARENYARNRYWQGIASITGNPAWSKMAGYYNPVVNEATRVGLVKQLQDAQAGDLNAINEVMGNMEIAKELELPPETAFANKNLLTALTANRRRLTDWDKAQLYDATRRYGFNSALDRALAVQRLRNQGALERAWINASIYGGGFPGVAPGLNMQGSVQTPMQQPNNASKDLSMQQIYNKTQQ